MEGCCCCSQCKLLFLGTKLTEPDVLTVLCVRVTLACGLVSVAVSKCVCLL